MAQEDARDAIDDGRHEADQHLVLEVHDGHEVDVVVLGRGVLVEVQRGEGLQRARVPDRVARHLHVPPARVRRAVGQVPLTGHVGPAKDVGVAAVVCGRQLAVKLAHLDALAHVQAEEVPRLLLVEDQLRVGPREGAIGADRPDGTLQPGEVVVVEVLGVRGRETRGGLDAPTVGAHRAVVVAQEGRVVARLRHVGPLEHDAWLAIAEVALGAADLPLDDVPRVSAALEPREVEGVALAHQVLRVPLRAIRAAPPHLARRTDAASAADSHPFALREAGRRRLLFRQLLGRTAELARRPAVGAHELRLRCTGAASSSLGTLNIKVLAHARVRRPRAMRTAGQDVGRRQAMMVVAVHWVPEQRERDGGQHAHPWSTDAPRP